MTLKHENRLKELALHWSTKEKEIDNKTLYLQQNSK